MKLRNNTIGLILFCFFTLSIYADENHERSLIKNDYNYNWSYTLDDKILSKSIEEYLKEQLEVIPDIEFADVNVASPSFDDNRPVSVIIILKTIQDSDFLQDIYQIQKIERMVLSVVQDLKLENLVITDTNGEMINDFYQVIIDFNYELLTV